MNSCVTLGQTSCRTIKCYDAATQAPVAPTKPYGFVSKTRQKKTQQSVSKNQIVQQFIEKFRDKIDFAELPSELSVQQLQNVYQQLTVYEDGELNDMKFDDIVQKLKQGDGEVNPMEDFITSLNPVAFGRKQRQALDSVWNNLVSFASTSKSLTIVDDISRANAVVTKEFPQAVHTRVLVVGAGGRVGRILTRKLAQRGYKVRAMVRPAADAEEDISDFPDDVEIFEADLAEDDPSITRDMFTQVMDGVDKVVYCASARSDNNFAIGKVNAWAVRDASRFLKYQLQQNVIKQAFIDGKLNCNLRVTSSNRRLSGDWSMEQAISRGGTERAYFQPDGQGGVFFKGTASLYDAFILTVELNTLQSSSYEDAIAFGLRVQGDGQQYYMAATTVDGYRYWHRFTTSPTRATSHLLPFALFQPENDEIPPQLDHSQIASLSFCFVGEIKKSDRLEQDLYSSVDRLNIEIPFELNVKNVMCTTRTKFDTEPQFVFVSSCGVGLKGKDPESTEMQLKHKFIGEQYLRLQGIPYTIVRPGPVVSEPGGYRGLVVEQRQSLFNPISAADVADVCLRCLHEPLAVNKTFDIGSELRGQGDGLELQLVSSVRPKLEGNYLAPALRNLKENEAYFPGQQAPSGEGPGVAVGGQVESSDEPDVFEEAQSQVDSEGYSDYWKEIQELSNLGMQEVGSGQIEMEAEQWQGSADMETDVWNEYPADDQDYYGDELSKYYEKK